MINEGLLSVIGVIIINEADRYIAVCTDILWGFKVSSYEMKKVRMLMISIFGVSYGIWMKEGDASEDNRKLSEHDYCLVLFV